MPSWRLRFARGWLVPEKGLAVDRDKMRIRISRIFKWFDEDFGGSRGVLAFVERYAPANDQAWLKDHRDETPGVVF